jgi:hypothetical protein
MSPLSNNKFQVKLLFIRNMYEGRKTVLFRVYCVEMVEEFPRKLHSCFYVQSSSKIYVSFYKSKFTV